jgi:hypothetical protein
MDSPRGFPRWVGAVTRATLRPIAPEALAEFHSLTHSDPSHEDDVISECAC